MTFQNYLPGSTSGHTGQHATNYFSLQIDGVQVGSFMNVSGLSLEIEVKEVLQSTPKGDTITMKVPVRPKYNEVTLKHAVDNSTALFDWYMEVEAGKIATARKNATITLFTPDGQAVEEWSFKNAWPSAWKTNDLDAAGSDVLTEEVTIQHEGVTRKRK